METLALLSVLEWAIFIGDGMLLQPIMALESDMG